MPIQKDEVEHSADHQLAKEDVQTVEAQQNGHTSPKENAGVGKDVMRTTGSEDISDTPSVTSA